MTEAQARQYLAAVEQADDLHDCTHGHGECALTPGGRCSAEVAGSRWYPVMMLPSADDLDQEDA